MAPARVYAEPHEQLTQSLVEAKLEGLSFEEAWDRALRPGCRLVLATTVDAPVGAVRWPTDTAGRLEWQRAILAVRDGFRRAYQDRPLTRREMALVPAGVLFEAGPARGIVGVAAVRSAA